MDINKYITALGKLAKASAGLMARATTAQKNNALHAIAENIIKHRSILSKANKEDLKAAKDKNLEGALVDRVKRSDARIDSMVEG